MTTTQTSMGTDTMEECNVEWIFDEEAKKCITHARVSDCQIKKVMADHPSNLSIPPSCMSVTLEEMKVFNMCRPKDESSDEFWHHES